jgi:hypothetical protein
MPRTPFEQREKPNLRTGERPARRKGTIMAEQSARVSEFIEEIVALSKRFGFSLSHEDGHGSFIVETFTQHNVDWLRDADDQTHKDPP